MMTDSETKVKHISMWIEELEVDNLRMETMIVKLKATTARMRTALSEIARLTESGDLGKPQ